MNQPTKKDALTRDAILKLLSDVEVAKVSTSEGALRLVEGDEYIDLTELESGVQQMQASARMLQGFSHPCQHVTETMPRSIHRLPPGL